MSDPALNDPFHPGERLAQQLAGVRDRMAARGGRFIRDAMPDQHREFFSHLPYLAIATTDQDGWPCATLITGTPGFISSPDLQTLRIAALPAAVDPVRPALVAGTGVGLLGIDFATRRRNRANGVLSHVDAESLRIAVRQSYGNCAQYIQQRELAETLTSTAGPRLQTMGDRLDASAAHLIARADTFFVASVAGDQVDISHRGGRPGFVRLEDNALTIPDFAGNRYFNTLGNFLVLPRAALLFVDFHSGDLLHVAGTVEIVWDSEEARHLAGAERLWRVKISSAWRLEAALPWRWSSPEYAPTTERTGVWEAQTAGITLTACSSS